MLSRNRLLIHLLLVLGVCAPVVAPAEDGDWLLRAGVHQINPDKNNLPDVLGGNVVLDKARLDARRVWIVDPLDGTREFSEPPRDDWAVHVALWANGQLVAGAVAQPALGQTFHTGVPPAVPPSQCRLRTSLMATHTFDQIDFALDQFARIGRDLGVV